MSSAAEVAEELSRAVEAAGLETVGEARTEGGGCAADVMGKMTGVPTADAVGAVADRLAEEGWRDPASTETGEMRQVLLTERGWTARVRAYPGPEGTGAFVAVVATRDGCDTGTAEPSAGG
ncbi:hypothetical protein F0L17_16165 [Streptomyces sp. TRM43335]|uniref:Uncharacterized protein n=1 Tax=Streptomyces taklimakanensis TaxID=2569853 RepID=A0A6G2BEH9_9ACTN|nr:hypothetical protein [Streptomyces taklimakanensis]MTE20614.1 hypothetical protein [Streptomyces taklimakanensis]